MVIHMFISLLRFAARRAVYLVARTVGRCSVMDVSGLGAGSARPLGTRADGTYIILKILIIYTWASKTTSPRQDFLTFRVIFLQRPFPQHIKAVHA